MNRPRRSEHTREALIEAGIDQLSLYGYHGTGIKQILDEVKVPKGSFYNYFASKEVFVAELIEHYTQDLMAQMQDFLEGYGKSLSPLDQLRSIMDYSLKKFESSQCQKACLIGSMGAEIAAESQICRVELDKATSAYLAILAKIFEQAQKQDQVRDDMPAAAVAHMYWATWEGALIKMKMQGQVAPVKEIMRTLLNTLKPVA